MPQLAYTLDCPFKRNSLFPRNRETEKLTETTISRQKERRKETGKGRKIETKKQSEKE